MVKILSCEQNSTGEKGSFKVVNISSKILKPLWIKAIHVVRLEAFFQLALPLLKGAYRRATCNVMGRRRHKSFKKYEENRRDYQTIQIGGSEGRPE
jgi:hypothetical protein